MEKKTKTRQRLSKQQAQKMLQERRAKALRSAQRKHERADHLTDLIIKEGTKQFGEATFARAEDMLGNIKGFVSTSIPPLDVLLTGEIGKGFAYGRYTELIGEADVGKTTLGCYAMRNVQREGGIAVLLDTERTLTRKRLAELGVKTDSRLVVIQDNILEDIGNRIEFVLSKIGQTPAVIFWDTIASSVTRSATSKRLGESMKIGEHAQLLANLFRKITTPLSQSCAALIMCNQRKEGGIGQLFVNARKRDATLGGEAVKFHTIHRLKLGFQSTEKNKETRKRSQQFIVTGETLKNKVSPSRLQGRFVISTSGDVSEFDIPLSFVRTMQAWGSFSTGRHLCKDSRGQGITPQRFADSYDKDRAFTAEMNARLIATYNELNMRQASGETASALVNM